MATALGRLAGTRKNNFVEQPLSLVACGGSLQKSHSQNYPPDLLDRGCISRRRFLSRKEREEMEGGNGVREANGITQFAEGEPKRLNCAYQNDASR